MGQKSNLVRTIILKKAGFSAVWNGIISFNMKYANPWLRSFVSFEFGVYAACFCRVSFIAGHPAVFLGAAGHRKIIPILKFTTINLLCFLSWYTIKSCIVPSLIYIRIWWLIVIKAGLHAGTYFYTSSTIDEVIGVYFVQVRVVLPLCNINITSVCICLRARDKTLGSSKVV